MPSDNGFPEAQEILGISYLTGKMFPDNFTLTCEGKLADPQEAGEISDVR